LFEGPRIDRQAGEANVYLYVSANPLSRRDPTTIRRALAPHVHHAIQRELRSRPRAPIQFVFGTCTIATSCAPGTAIATLAPRASTAVALWMPICVLVGVSAITLNRTCAGALAAPRDRASHGRRRSEPRFRSGRWRSRVLHYPCVPREPPSQCPAPPGGKKSDIIAP
jgi:hypothetical protein